MPDTSVRERATATEIGSKTGQVDLDSDAGN